MPTRFDTFGTVRKAQRTPEGYLLAEVAATRAGILPYRRADGSISLELIPSDELQKALPSLGRVPVTLGHPSVSVDASNVGEFGVGLTDYEVKLERDGWVRTAVQVLRQDAVEVAEKVPFVSVGKHVRVDETPGWWNGITTHIGDNQPSEGRGWVRFDAVQRDIRFNHLAIGVDFPRAGVGARLRLDDAEADVRVGAMLCDAEASMRTDRIEQRDGKYCAVSESGKSLGCYDTENEARERLRQVEAAKAKKDGERKMPQMTLDGVIYDFPEAVVAPVQALSKRADDLSKELKEAKEAHALLHAEAEGLRGKVKALEKTLGKAEEEKEAELEGAVNDRLDALAAAAVLRIQQIREKTTAQLRKDCVNAKFPDLKLEGKSDEYIQGLFEGVRAGLKAPSIDEIRGAAPRSDSGNDMIELRRDALKRLAGRA